MYNTMGNYNYKGEQYYNFNVDNIQNKVNTKGTVY